MFSLVLAVVLPLQAQAQTSEPVWTDPEVAAKENPDFLIQGEYYKQGAGYGVQVIAIGKGNFDAVVCKGGLPGAGMESGKKHIPLKGSRDGDIVRLAGERAASKSEPKLEIKAEIKAGELRLSVSGEEAIILPRVERKSPTLGAAPPEGAVVLFDGSSVDAWKNGVMENGLLKANNSMSKQSFKSYTAHIEFRTPFKPETLGQDRGNSGIYHYGRWETQILDSFGLKAGDRQTGGIYSIAQPLLNMCLPPLTWQTYDVDLTAPSFDTEGKCTVNPRITVKLNGVVIHQDLELGKSSTTAAPIRGGLTDEGGPIFLQNHNNPVYFRNIWVIPR